MEEYRHEEVDKHGGHARPGAEDGGAPVQGGRQTWVAVARGTTVVMHGMTAVACGTLAELCLAPHK
jgi:hypothetical protein